MTRATKLTADNVPTAKLHRLEPHVRFHSRARILSGTHRNEGQVVNDILAGDINNHRTAHGQLERTRIDEVVLAVGIVELTASLIVLRNCTRIPSAEHQVIAWILEIPQELLAHGTEFDGVRTGRIVISLT